MMENNSLTNSEIILPSASYRLKEGLRKNWYMFSRNKLSVIGLAIVLAVVLTAVFAPLLSPYPQHAGKFVDYQNANLPPSGHYFFGTDVFGRDILTRIFFSLRGALVMPILVLTMSVPVGVFLGLVAGYFKGNWIDTVIMRVTDIFLAVPPLLLALF